MTTPDTGQLPASQAEKASRVHRQHRSSGQARREALLEAAVDVIAIKGMAGVTHRAVTEAADVPLATVSYFFDSIDDLAAEAIRVYSQRRIDQLREIVEQAQTQSPQPKHLSALLAKSPLSARSIRAMVEVYLHASREANMRQFASEMLDSIADFAAATLRVAGASEPESMARAFVALSDGYSLHSMASADGQIDTEDLTTATQAMFLGYLLTQGHISEATNLVANRTQGQSTSPRLGW